MQREFSDQNTQKSSIQFLCLMLLITSISFIRHSFPLSSLQAAYFENAFTAQLLPSSTFSARQTEAKFPLPIFFLGLNCSWNPRWLTLDLRNSLHWSKSKLDRRTQVLLASFFQKVMEGGEDQNANLTSKSKMRYALDLDEDSMRHFQQMETETSPQLSLFAWQVRTSFPSQRGAPLEQRGVLISIPNFNNEDLY